ncbi:yqcI/YcgG family domain-containing protein [Ditylenchus destructor]|uniref:YqcI/YcgG family domain-containing protein n=1 Tax=Ditylenchus destructor TaxID=166010 RepID=A0AAD4MFH9_9BILA|nr:yqcI/YcgG family domain-containing protein [Ditylenchus destructor]
MSDDRSNQGTGVGGQEQQDQGPPQEGPGNDQRQRDEGSGLLYPRANCSAPATLISVSEQSNLNINQLFDFIRSEDFPCVGAKSALATGMLRVIEARDITSGWNDLQIHGELFKWAHAYRSDPSGLRSLAVVFDSPADLDEARVRAGAVATRSKLGRQGCVEGPALRSTGLPRSAKSHFSLSFGGEAFFVIGLHPKASRPARCFSKPTLVFNLHDQFERLRAEGRYERMRERILARDEALAGSLNPMLARHGQASAAAQYSGRVVEENWRCPFHDPRTSHAD